MAAHAGAAGTCTAEAASMAASSATSAQARAASNASTSAGTNGGEVTRSAVTVGTAVVGAHRLHSAAAAAEGWRHGRSRRVSAVSVALNCAVGTNAGADAARVAVNGTRARVDAGAGVGRATAPSGARPACAVCRWHQSDGGATLRLHGAICTVSPRHSCEPDTVDSETACCACCACGAAAATRSRAGTGVQPDGTDGRGEATAAPGTTPALERRTYGDAEESAVGGAATGAAGTPRRCAWTAASSERAAPLRRPCAVALRAGRAVGRRGDERAGWRDVVTSRPVRGGLAASRSEPGATTTAWSR